MKGQLNLEEKVLKGSIGCLKKDIFGGQLRLEERSCVGLIESQDYKIN